MLLAPCRTGLARLWRSIAIHGEAATYAQRHSRPSCVEIKLQAEMAEGRKAAVNAAELQQWVVSGSSSRALEGSLFRIVLTFTRQASLGPQQPISFAVTGHPGGDIESETLALSIRNTQLCSVSSDVPTGSANPRRQSGASACPHPSQCGGGGAATEPALAWLHAAFVQWQDSTIFGAGLELDGEAPQFGKVPDHAFAFGCERSACMLEMMQRERPVAFEVNRHHLDVGVAIGQ